MVLPFYESSNTYGECIFDTCRIKNKRFLNFENHFQRLQASLQMGLISLPMSEDMLKQRMSEIADFCYKHYQIDDNKESIFLRIYVSRGIQPIEFEKLELEKPGNIYITAVLAEYHKERFNKGVKDFSFLFPNIPHRKGIMSKIKTTNYYQNTLLAQKSHDLGGYIGIIEDEQGNLVEGATANFAVVHKDNYLYLSDSPDKLDGTTLKNCLQYVKQKLMPNGIITGIIEKPISIQDIYDNAKEMFFLHGDACIPILSLNNVIISEKPGPIALKLLDYLFDEYNGDHSIYDFMRKIDKKQQEQMN